MTSSEFSGGTAVVAEQLLIQNNSGVTVMQAVPSGNAAELDIFNSTGTQVGKLSDTGLTFSDPNTGNTVSLASTGDLSLGTSDPSQLLPGDIFTNITDNPPNPTRQIMLILNSGKFNLRNSSALSLLSASEDGTVSAKLVVDPKLYAQDPTAGNTVTADVPHAVAGGVNFATGWSDLGSGFGKVSYWLSGDGQRCEFSGMAAFSGTVAAPSLVFTLPSQYWPNRSINLAVSTSPAPGTNPTTCTIQIQTNGKVFVTNYSGAVNPGPVSFENQGFALTSNV